MKYKGLVVLVDELIKQGKLLHLALYASSEAVRGIKKMKQPALESSSVAEFTSIFDGSYFKGKMDPMEAYGLVKYGATLWMSYMARKHPGIKFVSMSPGGTKGTVVMDDMPALQKIMFKHIMMPQKPSITSSINKNGKSIFSVMPSVCNPG